MKVQSKRFKISEVSHRLKVGEAFVVHCIHAQWVQPISPDTAELDEEDIARLELIRELQEDFGVNEQAVPIILHLLDQLYFLRRQLQEFTSQSSHQSSKRGA
jgi:chaperone modulatory protein CbpM